MATSLPNTLGNTGKYGDLKRRLIFLVLALVVYRVLVEIEDRLIYWRPSKQVY